MKGALVALLGMWLCIGAVHAAEDPCATKPDTDPCTVTPAPPAPTMAPPMPSPKPTTVCQIPHNPGAFEPWMTYRFLQVNTPEMETPGKYLMGGRTIKISGLEYGLPSEDFTCVKEDNEWKARVMDPAKSYGTFTMQYYAGYPPNETVVTDGTCFLQDISLFRTKEGIPGMRFDYGHCPVKMGPLNDPTTGDQAFILIGLKQVPDGTPVPGLSSFFKGVCGQGDVSKPSPTPAPPPPETPCETAMPCSTSTPEPAPNGPFLMHLPCLGNQLDYMLMHSPKKGCFNMSSAFTVLNSENEFPTFPVTASEWEWLVSVLPVGSLANEDPCALPIEPKTFGQVLVDRMCLTIEGMVNCTNICDKFCMPFLEGELITTTTTVWVQPGECKDCEIEELVYAVLTTFWAFWWTYRFWYYCIRQDSDWVNYLNGSSKFEKSIGTKPEDDPYSPMLTHEMAPVHSLKQPGLYAKAATKSLFACFVVTTLCFYAINLLDWLVEEVIFQKAMCLRLWSFQYDPYKSQCWKDSASGNCPLHPPNPWCTIRLWGLIIIVTFSDWICLSHWNANKSAAQIELITIERGTMETTEDMGAVFFGGAFGGAGGSVNAEATVKYANQDGYAEQGSLFKFLRPASV